MSYPAILHDFVPGVDESSSWRRRCPHLRPRVVDGGNTGKDGDGGVRGQQEEEEEPCNNSSREDDGTHVRYFVSYLVHRISAPREEEAGAGGGVVNDDEDADANKDNDATHSDHAVPNELHCNGDHSDADKNNNKNKDRSNKTDIDAEGFIYVSLHNDGDIARSRRRHNVRTSSDEEEETAAPAAAKEHDGRDDDDDDNDDDDDAAVFKTVMEDIDSDYQFIAIPTGTATTTTTPSLSNTTRKRNTTTQNNTAKSAGAGRRSSTPANATRKRRSLIPAWMKSSVVITSSQQIYRQIRHVYTTHILNTQPFLRLPRPTTTATTIPTLRTPGIIPRYLGKLFWYHPNHPQHHRLRVLEKKNSSSLIEFEDDAYNTTADSVTIYDRNAIATSVRLFHSIPGKKNNSHHHQHDGSSSNSSSCCVVTTTHDRSKSNNTATIASIVFTSSVSSSPSSSSSLALPVWTTTTTTKVTSATDILAATQYRTDYDNHKEEEDSVCVFNGRRLVRTTTPAAATTTTQSPVEQWTRALWAILHYQAIRYYRHAHTVYQTSVQKATRLLFRSSQRIMITYNHHLQNYATRMIHNQNKNNSRRRWLCVHNTTNNRNTNSESESESMYHTGHNNSDEDGTCNKNRRAPLLQLSESILDDTNNTNTNISNNDSCHQNHWTYHTACGVAPRNTMYHHR